MRMHQGFSTLPIALGMAPCLLAEEQLGIDPAVVPSTSDHGPPVWQVADERLRQQRCGALHADHRRQ